MVRLTFLDLTPARLGLALSLLGPTLVTGCSTAADASGGSVTLGDSTLTPSSGTGTTGVVDDPSTSAVPTTGAPMTTVYYDFGGGDDGSTGFDPSDTGTTGESLPPPQCGDGNVDADLGEECDLGRDNADAGECTLGCKLPVCGDGVVQGAEECDDGDREDNDPCTNACKAAACGDAIVGPGEACDDGNQVDDDACGNDCAPASCGDGKPQPGEVCDDGNADDTDACLSTCVAASCGDGFAQVGVEACDDGDADDTDACTALCAPPACDDELKSGAETDVDCGGGTCPACPKDQACQVDADCATGACNAGVCGVPATCLQIKQHDPASPDGVYTIDPDKSGPGEPFEVYCDMSVEGGGWTSLVHLTTLDRLNYNTIPHTQVAVSEASKFWIFAPKQGSTYNVYGFNEVPHVNLQAQGEDPASTGWLWNGVDYPNPPECHVIQQMILVQTPDEHPRSLGNPHFNAGQQISPALAGAALDTASTIGVATVANYPAIHIGCVGWNVLKDPILWVR